MYPHISMSGPEKQNCKIVGLSKKSTLEAIGWYENGTCSD